MKKSVLALVAAFALAGFAGMADAQRGGGHGGGGGGGWSGGGGHMSGGSSGGSWSGGGGGWHGGSGWHGGGGWRGGSGWHGGCWGCGGWWWGGVGVGVALTAPWWGWPYWGAPYYGYYAYPAYGVYDGYYAPDPAVYVEPARPAAPTYAPSAPGGVTWFYCTQPAGYYPYVQSCSKPWVRVVPDATQPPPASTY